MSDKIIITESEKDASDDWLINDMNKKSKAKYASNNKRKSFHFSDTESDQEFSPQKTKNTIINSDLEVISKAIEISRRTMITIKQNLLIKGSC